MTTVVHGEEAELRLVLRDAEGAPVAAATGVAIRAKPPNQVVRSYAVTAGARRASGSR